MEDFNLLISTWRGRESSACSEAWYLLKEVGDPDAQVDRTSVRGLVTAKTKLDAVEAVAKLKKLLAERPDDFRYVLKVIPIQVVVPANLEELKTVSKKLASKIGEKEKFKVEVEKRYTSLHRAEIIEAVAGEVDREVDLEHPDKVLLVEVLGSKVGVALIKPSDILSVAKERG